MPNHQGGKRDETNTNRSNRHTTSHRREITNLKSSYNQNKNQHEKGFIHTNAIAVTTNEKKRGKITESHTTSERNSIINDNNGSKVSPSSETKKHIQPTLNTTVSPTEVEKLSIDATSNQEIYASIVDSLIEKLEDEKQQQRIWREDMAKSIADMEKKVKNRINELNILFKSAKDEIIKKLAENGIEYNETKITTKSNSN